MRIGRRALFFATLCAICLVLIPATPSEFRWLNYAMAGLALFWSLAFVLEDVVNAREQQRRDRGQEQLPDP
jgi:hypothetical protein